MFGRSAAVFGDAWCHPTVPMRGSACGHVSVSAFGHRDAGLVVEDHGGVLRSSALVMTPSLR